MTICGVVCGRSRTLPAGPDTGTWVGAAPARASPKHACLAESRAFVVVLPGWTLMTKVAAKQIADCAEMESLHRAEHSSLVLPGVIGHGRLTVPQS